jgi:hypothetical protein
MMKTAYLSDDSATGSLPRVIVTVSHRKGLKSVIAYIVLLNKEADEISHMNASTPLLRVCIFFFPKSFLYIMLCMTQLSSGHYNAIAIKLEKVNTIM